MDSLERPRSHRRDVTVLASEQPDSTRLPAACDPRQGELPAATTRLSASQCPPTGKGEGITCSTTCSVVSATFAAVVACSPSKETGDEATRTSDVESSDSDAEYILVDEHGRAVMSDGTEHGDTGGNAGARNVSDPDTTRSDPGKGCQPAQAALTHAVSEGAAATGVDDRSVRRPRHEHRDVAAAAAAAAAAPPPTPLIDGDAGDDEYVGLEALHGQVPIAGLGDIASHFDTLVTSLKDFAKAGEVGNETVIFGRQIKYWSEAKLFHGNALRSFMGYAVDLDTQTLAESRGVFPAAEKAAQSAVHELVRELAQQPGITF